MNFSRSRRLRLTLALTIVAQFTACAIPQRPLVSPGAEAIFPFDGKLGAREEKTAMSTAQLGTLIGATACGDKKTVSECVAHALNAAYTEKTATALLRNRMQDYLIASSNEQCRIYKGKLRTASAEPNFWFGTFATLFGGAGAVTRSIEGARTLAGLAAASSGIRAEYNQDFFASQTADIIIGAINSSRKDKLTEIATARGEEGDTTLQKYTIERAVADAIEYHAKCSIAAGLTHANKALIQYDDIGMQRFDEVMTKLSLGPTAANKWASTAAAIQTGEWVSSQAALVEAARNANTTAFASANKRHKAKFVSDIVCTTAPTKTPCDELTKGNAGADEALKLLYKFDATTMKLDKSSLATPLSTATGAVQAAEQAFALAGVADERKTRLASLRAAQIALEVEKRKAEQNIAAALSAIDKLNIAIDDYLKS